MIRHRISVFIVAARLGLKNLLAEPLALLGGFMIYAVLIIAYGSVFKAISADELQGYHLTTTQLVWYLGVTEFVLFCGSSSHFRELQNDIQNDAIYMALLRPSPMWVVRLGDWAGQYLGRFLVLSLPSFGLIWCVAGGATPPAITFIRMLSALPVAGMILLISYFIVGASSLWLKQAEPLFWIWQKCLFLLGALLWPLVLYPDLLRHLIWLTPFPAVLATPASFLLARENSDLLLTVIHQLVWLLIGLCGVAVLNRALLSRIQREG